MRAYSYNSPDVCLASLTVTTFVLAYICVMLGFIFFLLHAAEGQSRGLSLQGWAAFLSASRARFGFFILLVNFAGIPPAFFFFIKLGALSMLAASGLLWVFTTLMGLLIFSWFIYFSTARGLLKPVLGAPQSKAANGPATAPLYVLYGLLTLVSLLPFMLSDLFALGAFLGV